MATATEKEPTAAEKAAAKAKEKDAAKAAAVKQKEEAQAKARKAKIDSGDLIVTKAHEFDATDKAPKSHEIVRKIISVYKKLDKPLVFSDVATDAGAKYPEDLIVAMYALEEQGLVKRFDARTVGGTQRRPKVAFLWVGAK